LKITKTVVLLILIGVAIGLLVARFGIPGLGPLSGVDTSAYDKPVHYT